MMEILNRTTLFDFSYAGKKNKNKTITGNKENAPKAKSRGVASFNLTAPVIASASHNHSTKPRDESLDKFPKTRSRVIRATTPTKSKEQSHRSIRPRDESLDKFPKTRSRVIRATTPTKSKEQSHRSIRPRDESLDKFPKTRSRVISATTPTKSKGQSHRSIRLRDESQSDGKFRKKRSRVASVTTPTKSKGQSRRSRKQVDEERRRKSTNPIISRKKSVRILEHSNRKDLSDLYSDDDESDYEPYGELYSDTGSGYESSTSVNQDFSSPSKPSPAKKSKTVKQPLKRVAKESSTSINQVLLSPSKPPPAKKSKTVKEPLRRVIEELSTSESDDLSSPSKPSPAKKSKKVNEPLKRVTKESTSANQVLRSPSKSPPAKKSKTVKEPLRRAIKESSATVNQNFPSSSNPLPVKKSKTVKEPPKRAIEESSTSVNQVLLRSPSKSTPTKKSKTVKEPLRRVIEELSTSESDDLSSPSKPSPAKKSKKVNEPPKRVTKESSTSVNQVLRSPSKPPPAKKSKTVKEPLKVPRVLIERLSTSVNKDLPSSSKPLPAKKSQPVKKQPKRITERSRAKKGGSGQSSSTFKPITEIKLHETRSRTRAINVIKGKENVAPVDVVDSNNTDPDLQLLIEGSRINEYKQLQNSNKTGNKLSLSREQVTNSKSPLHFDVAGIEGSENMRTEYPGVQMSYMFPIPTASKHRLGFISMEGRTVRPPMQHDNLMTMIWVLSGCVTLRTSAQIHNNHSLHHFKMGAGSCFVIPSWTVFTLENWETEPVKLGICLFESG